jgi:hypothetical protein
VFCRKEAKSFAWYTANVRHRLAKKIKTAMKIAKCRNAENFSSSILIGRVLGEATCQITFNIKSTILALFYCKLGATAKLLLTGLKISFLYGFACFSMIEFKV